MADQVYIDGMTKRLIDVDDHALERARAMLDGATIKETVNTALREFCDRETRERLFEHIQELAAGDLGDPEVMRSAWRE